jgi:PPOX class probable F420-dependent enzyme
MPDSSPLPDPASAFGQAVRRRLRDDLLVWLTTTGADGTPQPNPVWFLWQEEDDSLLVYSFAGAARLRHLRLRPAVSLNLDGAEESVAVILGRASLAEAEPPADRHPGFLAKYGHLMSAGPEQWARRFPVAIRVHLVRVRGHIGADTAA